MNFKPQTKSCYLIWMLVSLETLEVAAVNMRSGVHPLPSVMLYQQGHVRSHVESHLASSSQSYFTAIGIVLACIHVPPCVSFSLRYRRYSRAVSESLLKSFRPSHRFGKSQE